jgi:hypothetical protein
LRFPVDGVDQDFQAFPEAVRSIFMEPGKLFSNAWKILITFHLRGLQSVST